MGNHPEIEAEPFSEIWVGFVGCGVSGDSGNDLLGIGFRDFALYGGVEIGKIGKKERHFGGRF